MGYLDTYIDHFSKQPAPRGDIETEPSGNEFGSRFSLSQFQENEKSAIV